MVEKQRHVCYNSRREQKRRNHMTLTRYYKEEKDWIKKITTPVNAVFYALLPKRLKGTSGIATLSFLMGPLAILGLAGLAIPYVIGFAFIYALKVFPFPILGVMIVVTHSAVLFYSIVVRTCRRFAKRWVLDSEHKYRKKVVKKKWKEYPWYLDAFEHPEKYDYTPAQLDRVTRQEYYKFTDRGTNDYDRLLGRIQSPSMIRQTAGRSEYLPKEAVISKYRAQVRYASHPEDYIVYYTDSCGPDVAERCLKDFLEKTRDDIITDCADDGGLTLMKGLEHEIYIDFYNGYDHGDEKTYVADGTVDYDYDSKDIA